VINYVPKIRITPVAGPVKNYTLSAITHLTRGRVFYEKVVIDKEMLTRAVRQKVLGYRVRAEIEFMLAPTPTTDQVTLAEVLREAAADGAETELSMGVDAFGADLYRAVGIFEESVEYPGDVLSVVRYIWALTIRDLIPAYVEPGQGAVAVW